MAGSLPLKISNIEQQSSLYSDLHAVPDADVVTTQVAGQRQLDHTCMDI